MRALVLTRHGPPEVLEVREVPDPPAPAPGEIRVAVRAAGINFADLMARIGMYRDAPKPPSIIGYEVAGEVESVGEDVTDVRPGDRVIAGTRFGGYAELALSPSGAWMPLPGDWSFEQGAALVVNYATAYGMLVRYGNVRPGERVLIHAAAGGVGIAATQIAKQAGAEIFGTASAAKHEAIRGFGVDHAIDYRSEDFVEAVRVLTGQEEPIDIALDAIGGSSWKKSFALLRAGGRLVCFGAAGLVTGDKRDIPAALKTLVGTPRFNPIKLATESKAVIGFNVLRLWDAHGTLQEYLDGLRRGIDDGTLSPVVAESFPVERGGDAHRYLQQARNVGKVVLTL
jgi:NADPH:quinone reductase-like Zn-dependent oxidoreductase